MENLNNTNFNFNAILNRTHNAEKIEFFLQSFFNNSNNSNNNNSNLNNSNNNNISYELSNKDLSKKAIYLYGNNGIGKTTFIYDLIKELNYDILYLDNSILRNKSLIESISENNLSNNNVYSMFYNKPKKIVIIIDDINSMNNSDKSSIMALTKLIREKKTKKQKMENLSNSPIICINSYSNDKKIIELMKVCYNIELSSPKNEEIEELLFQMMPNLYNSNIEPIKLNIIKDNILKYLNNSFIKLEKLYFYYANDFIIDKFYIKNIELNDNKDNLKVLTSNLLKKYNDFNSSQKILESDRTILSLLFHENLLLLLKPEDYKIYLEILDNFVFSDYIDRIIFQKQIWQLTEINFLIKIYYNNYLCKYYNLFNNNINENEIIFTKILTKYSSEYNNQLFFYMLNQVFLSDKKDIINYFMSNKIENINYELFELNNVSKIEIERIYKFINNLLTNNINYEKNIIYDENYEY